MAVQTGVPIGVRSAPPGRGDRTSERSPRLRRHIGVLALAGTALVLGGCTGAPSARIVLSDTAAPVDVPFGARVSGVAPRTVVSVTAEARDASGTPWRSTARFRASTAGTFSLADPSLGGSYTGRDRAGLLEHMRPLRGRLTIFEAPEQGYEVQLTVSADRSQSARATARRRTPAALGVRSRTLTVVHDGVRGTLFLPAGRTTAPALLMFGGSGGGEEYDGVAAQIAAHGFPVLSLAYFGAADLPPTLEAIPIEYFVRALRLLAAQPSVDPKRLVALGTSRGSEAALLLGIHEPALVSAVIAVDPTDHANVALPTGTGAAWTIGGTPVPTAPLLDIDKADPADAPSSLFDVARILGPVLTICGTGDQIWPSCASADTIATRRRSSHHGGDRFIAYEGAGHGIGVLESIVPRTVQPWGGGDVLVGGTVPTDQAAITRAHLEILRFLEQLRAG